MAQRLMQNGEPLFTSDGRPLWEEDPVGPVEMTGSECGHSYLLQGPERKAYSTDTTRLDLVEQADEINRQRVQNIREAYQAKLCPGCHRSALASALAEADYELNPDSRARGYERLFGGRK